MPVEADSANNNVFHAGSFFPGNCPGTLLKARSHLELDTKFLRELHGPRLHHFCAATSHLKQLIISYFVEFFRVFNNSWIARENPVYIGENLAGVGVQGARQRNRRQVRAATAKRSCFSLGSLALKASHDNDVIVREQLVNLLWTDVRNS